MPLRYHATTPRLAPLFAPARGARGGARAGCSAYQEGLISPPVRVYRAGEPNDDLIKLMARNSRMPDSLRGDLDAEVAACKMGAERIADLFRRYGREQVEACFETILQRTTETFRRELLSKIPDGTYVWEDYA